MTPTKKKITKETNFEVRLPESRFLRSKFQDAARIAMSHYWKAGQPSKIEATVSIKGWLVMHAAPMDITNKCTLNRFLEKLGQLEAKYGACELTEVQRDQISCHRGISKDGTTVIFACDLACQNKPSKVGPYIWDNQTYLGKERDYKKAPIQVDLNPKLDPQI